MSISQQCNIYVIEHQLKALHEIIQLFAVSNFLLKLNYTGHLLKGRETGKCIIAIKSTHFALAIFFLIQSTKDHLVQWLLEEFSESIMKM